MNARRTAAAALTVLGVAVGCVFVIFAAGSRRTQPMRDLASDERRALYEKTWAAFSALCGGAVKADVRRPCRDDAELLRRFPECDAACVDATAPWLPQPTR